MRQRRYYVLLVIAILLVSLAACVSFTRDAYRTLTVSQQTYDTVLSTMGDLYREGKITDAQKQKAIELGRIYKTAHNAAVVALAKYEEQGGDTNQKAYLTAAEEVSKALAGLLAYCRPIIEKGGK